MKIIAGDFGGRSLKSINGPAGYRPAMAKVRKAVFSMVEARGVVWTESRVLDVFAGSGSCGFEALSRGAAIAHFMENAVPAAKIIQANAAMFGVEPERYHIYVDDAMKTLRSRPAQSFDVVFVDPPYGRNYITPAVTSLLRYGWLSPDALLIAEAEAAVEELPEVDARMELLVNRCYGQTRILIWAHRVTE